jgi:20S proteasome alpha/beta subunit
MRRSVFTVAHDIMNIFIPILFTALATSGLQTRKVDDVAHGTLNVALGNTNGLVLITDSMATIGSAQSPEPAQKLFKLDDRTVCTIAGFLFAPSKAQAVTTETAAIIRQYSLDLTRSGKQVSIMEKLQTISFILLTRLSALAAFRHSDGNADHLEAYRFQIIVAGYDSDGIAKIGKVDLYPDFLGRSYQVPREPDIVVIGEKLEHVTAGMPDVAEQLLAYPETEPDDHVLARFALSKQVDLGRSFTLGEMKDLALDLVKRTANVHREVGGPSQIAVLRNGHVETIDQPVFPEQQNPSPVTGFGFEREVSFSGRRSHVRAGPMVCYDCKFQYMPLTLDNTFIVESTFTAVILTYDGGPFFLNATNKIRNDSVLMLGPNVRIPSLSLRELVLNFPWLRVMNYANGTKEQRDRFYDLRDDVMAIVPMRGAQTQSKTKSFTPLGSLLVPT